MAVRGSRGERLARRGAVLQQHRPAAMITDSLRSYDGPHLYCRACTRPEYERPAGTLSRLIQFGPGSVAAHWDDWGQREQSS